MTVSRGKCSFLAISAKPKPCCRSSVIVCFCILSITTSLLHNTEIGSLF
nr:MAG TPA: hypothetical protein [Caudoviricetes sp.]